MPGFVSGLFSSLQFRLAMGFILALAVSLVLLGIATGVVAGKQAERFERDRDLVHAARVRQFVAEHYSRQGNWLQDRDNLQQALERAGRISGTRIKVFDQDGELVADSHTNIPPAPRDGRWRGWSKRRDDPREFALLSGEQQVGAFTVSDAGPPEPVPQGPVLADPLPSDISREVNRSLFWAGIGAAALGIAIVWLLSRRTLAPLQGLGEAARRLGRGDLSQRAQTNGPREIQQLAHNFNTMAAELEEAERHRRNLTADIAHELRTPLSNIQGYLEAIRDGLVQPTPDTLDTIHGQALQLSLLVEDLRLLAQVESGDLHLESAPVQVDELLRSSVEAVRPRADAKSLTLTLTTQPGLPPAEIDGARISQVISNLLENAITHTPQDGSVTVLAQAEAGQVEVTVVDSGPGIAPEDLPRLFDRFYRGDPSRSRSTGGTGLGLTIARRLVEAHDGSIDVHSVVGEGSRFTVRLPM